MLIAIDTVVVKVNRRLNFSRTSAEVENLLVVEATSCEKLEMDQRG
jgi:hypothetical protein